MKPQVFLPHFALCCSVALLSPVVHAQGVSAPHEITANVVRDDIVQADLSTPADEYTSLCFHRMVTSSPDNTYAVEITCPDGTLRMEGRYQDAELTTPDGDFTYFYPSGQVESTGAFDNGYKTGTWKCFTASGESRADRIYYGMDWEQLQFLVGLAERAPTVGEAEENMTAL